MPRVSKSDERAWLTLISTARSPNDPSAVLTAVKGTVGRAIPCTAHRDQAAFIALQALARAYGEGLRERRKHLSACLSGLAEECAGIIGLTTLRPAPVEASSWRSQDLFGS